MGTFFENFAFHPEMFVTNLKYMGLGMLCILIVIGVIILLTILLERFSSFVARRREKKSGSDGE